MAGPPAVKDEGRITKDEIETAAGETFGLLGVLGLETRAQRGVLDMRGQGLDELGSTLLAAGSLRETRAQQDNRSQQVKALTLHSPEGRGFSGTREDEILVDVLAESIAAGRSTGLGETGLPLRRAVFDVMALWPA